MNYLYYASQNFRGFIENGFGDGKIDLKDMLILSYFAFWESRKEPDRQDGHIWIHRKSMLNSLPFLGIKTVNALTDRTRKLVKLGLITKLYLKAENGSDRMYVSLTSLALSCLDGQEITINQDLKPPVSEDCPPPISKQCHPLFLESATPYSKTVPIIKSNNDKKNKDKRGDSTKLRFSVFQREMFEKIFKAFGAKADRIDSEFEFMKLKPNGDTFDKIMAGIEWDSEKTWGELKYKPKLSSWLNKKVFEDIFELRLNFLSDNKEEAGITYIPWNDRPENKNKIIINGMIVEREQK